MFTQWTTQRDPLNSYSKASPKFPLFLEILTILNWIYFYDYFFPTG